MLYARARVIYWLPFVHAFMVVPGLRWLILASYAESVRIGPGSDVLGYLYDPDLTEIGASTIGDPGLRSSRTA